MDSSTGVQVFYFHKILGQRHYANDNQYGVYKQYMYIMVIW